MGETYNPKPNLYTVFLLNCKKLDSHSYHKVLKDAISGIEVGANEENDTIQYLLPVMPGIEYWCDYSSTQVSFTIELPPNLFGFAYYLVLSQGHVRDGVRIRCECYLDNISGERICIKSFPSANIFKFYWCYGSNNKIHMKSDHVVLWYDPVSCKKIMEEIKAINDVNSTNYNPKLTFTFFIDETLREVTIKKCGVRWIYEGEMVTSTIFESLDEEETASSSYFQSNDQEQTVPPTIIESDDQVQIVPPTNLELDETKDLR
jgi:hypothetical protein